MIRLLVVAVLAFASMAQAGPLGEGQIKGLSFGPDSVLSNPPSDICVTTPASGVRWQCESTFGGQEATVNYLADAGLFYGANIAASGYTECKDLLRTLNAAWGEGRQDNPYIEKYAWNQSNVGAAYEWNYFTKSCSVTVLNADLYLKVEAAKNSRAAHSANDL